MSELETQNAELIEQINSLQAAYGRMVDEHFEEKKELKAQLAKANERVRELEKNSKDSFISFAKKHNTVDGPTALFIHALGVAFDKEQLRKEQGE